MSSKKRVVVCVHCVVQDWRIDVITPTGARIVVEPEDSEEVSPGGIVMPDVAREKPTKGLVLMVGPEATDDSGNPRMGATVLFRRYSGFEVEYDGKTLLILNKEDILGVM